MSRVSSTAKRYAGPSYTSHYSSYSSSLTPGLSSYSERDRLSTYKSPTSSSTSSSGYSSSSYLSSSAARSRNYSTSSDPDRDRGRTIPRTDILGSSSSSNRRSESLSRTPVKSYGGSGLSGGSTYTGYSSYSSSSAQSSYLSSSPMASSISLSRRKSVSQSDLSRDLASLGLNDASSSSSSTPSSSTSALRSYRSRASDVANSYGTSSRLGYSGLSRSSTQEALSRSSTQDAFNSSSSSRAYSSSTWEPSSNGLSDSPTRDSKVRECLLILHMLPQSLLLLLGMRCSRGINIQGLRKAEWSHSSTTEAHWFHLFSFTLMVKPHNALWLLRVLVCYQMGALLLKLISIHLKSWFTVIYQTCYILSHDFNMFLGRLLELFYRLLNKKKHIMSYLHNSNIIMQTGGHYSSVCK